jgi:integrase
MTTVGISSSRARVGFGLFRDLVLADLEVILSSITRRSIMNHNNNAKRNTKSSDASHDVPRRIESRRLLPEGLPNQIRSNVGEARLDASLDQSKPPRDPNNAIAHRDPAVPPCAPLTEAARSTSVSTTACSLSPFLAPALTGDSPHLDAGAIAKMPTHTAVTGAGYRRRYKQLGAEAIAALAPTTLSITRFADWLIEKKRPGLAAASWRQYRASVVCSLKRLAVQRPVTAEPARAAIARLNATPPLPPDSGSNRTSARKAKRLSGQDLERIRTAAHAANHKDSDNLGDFLESSTLTGARPSEWPNARLQPSTVPGFRWELQFNCAKGGNGRSHSPRRTLRWIDLPPDLLTVLRRWMNTVDSAVAENRYEKLQKALGDLMYRISGNIFQRRKRCPTLYSPRHEAAARWKSEYMAGSATLEQRLDGAAMVASLLGHASDSTATIHYGRPHRGESGGLIYPTPVPDGAEVARVRKRLARKVERLALRSARISPKP